jgi:hypothetical protein
MALIFPNSTCAICQQPLGSERIFATSGVFLPANDPLFEFCDAGMHWSCYAKWPHRLRFAKAYVDMWVEMEKQNPYWGRAYLDESVFVTVGPAVEQASVQLYETGSSCRVPFAEWENWLVELKPDLEPIEREALERVLPRLRAALPTPQALIEAVDWDSKKRLADQMSAGRAQAEQKRVREAAAHNEACAQMEPERQQSGFTCRNCGTRSKEFRYLDLRPTKKSYFICKKCGHTLMPS